jgi:hypothetical protein
MSAQLLLVWLMATQSSALADPLTQAELDANRSLWDGHNISDYDVTLGYGCFCEPNTYRPGIVSVRSDVVVSVIDAQNGQPLPPANYTTIDQLFVIAQRALGNPELQVDAQFDSQFGFPKRLRLDDPLLGDDDFTYGIISFTPVPEPGWRWMSLLSAAGLMAARRSR